MCETKPDSGDLFMWCMAYACKYICISNDSVIVADIALVKCNWLAGNDVAVLLFWNFPPICALHFDLSGKYGVMQAFLVVSHNHARSGKRSFKVSSQQLNSNHACKPTRCCASILFCCFFSLSSIMPLLTIGYTRDHRPRLDPRHLLKKWGKYMTCASAYYKM